jgi:hypothetical protein
MNLPRLLPPRIAIAECSSISLGANAPKQHGRGKYVAVITCRLSLP